LRDNLYTHIYFTKLRDFSALILDLKRQFSARRMFVFLFLYFCSNRDRS